jgi:ABC-type nitrate/sulfonate/bicarbonate transport system substrate-binding protein
VSRTAKLRSAVPAAIAVLALSLVAAACGGSGDSESGDKGTIEFVFSPDPAWSWIEDQGILADMEEESGYHIRRFETEDEFAAFAGGHADIVSTGSYDTPVLEDETGVTTVTIGKFNRAQDIVVSDDETAYNSFGDLPEGCKVGVEAFEGSSLVWQALAADLHDRELAQGSDDLQMAITDFEVSPELVTKGDLCAGVTAMTTSIPYLMDESVHVMYDGKTASQLYEEEYEPGHIGMNSNNFVTLESWYEENPGEVGFFLEVWEVAMNEWKEHRDEIIEQYQEDFGWTNDEELKFVQDYYENVYDNFLDTVYLDPEWIQGEAGVTQILRDAEIIPEDQPDPIMVCIDPETGEESCRFPEA